MPRYAKAINCVHCGQRLTLRWDGAVMHALTSLVRCRQGWHALASVATPPLGEMVSG